MEEINVIISAKINLPKGMTFDDLKEKFENEIATIIIDDDDQTSIELNYSDIQTD